MLLLHAGGGKGAGGGGGVSAEPWEVWPGRTEEGRRAPRTTRRRPRSWPAVAPRTLRPRPTAHSDTPPPRAPDSTLGVSLPWPVTSSQQGPSILGLPEAAPASRAGGVDSHLCPRELGPCLMVLPARSGSFQGDICKSEELCSSCPDKTPQGSLSLCTVQAGGLADKTWELRPPKSPSLPLTSLASGPTPLCPGPPGLSAQLSPAWDAPVRAGFSVGWPGVIAVAECHHYGGAL